MEKEEDGRGKGSIRYVGDSHEARKLSLAEVLIAREHFERGICVP